AGLQLMDPLWQGDDDTRLWADVGMAYILTETADGFVLQMMDRDETDEIARFSRAIEAEKFLLCRFWDSARGLSGLERTRRRWFNQGYVPGVSVTEVGSRIVLRLPNEPESECATVDDGDAIAFSHAMVLTI